MSLYQSFARSGFAQFINSPAGRIVRIVAGIALIVWGYTQLDHTAGIVWMIVGIVPLSAGLLDLCIVSPMVGGPVSGRKVREAADQEHA